MKGYKRILKITHLVRRSEKKFKGAATINY